MSDANGPAGHRFDYNTPIEETVGALAVETVNAPMLIVISQMQALHDVVQAGYVRYIGMSSCWAYHCTLPRSHTMLPPFSPQPLSPCHAKYVCTLALSSKPSRRLKTLRWVDYAITHNLTPFISMQNHYNLMYREEEREMMPTLKV